MRNITATIQPEKIICSEAKDVEDEKLIKLQEERCLPTLVGCVGQGRGKAL